MSTGKKRIKEVKDVCDDSSFIDVEEIIEDLDFDKDLKCHICEKGIEDPMDAFSYNILQESNSESIDELLFCSKKCWNEHILREAERIRFEKRLTQINSEVKKKKKK